MAKAPAGTRVARRGTLLGQALTIRVTPASFTAVPRHFLTWGGTTLELDGNLPANLGRLIPWGWGNQPVEAWLPFVTLAVGLRLL